MRTLLSSLVVLVLLALPRVALAHQVGLSRGDYQRDGNVVRVDLVLARGDAGVLELSAATDPSELVAIASCTGRLESLVPTTGDGIELRAVYTCPGPAATSVDVKLVSALAGGHRHLAHVGGRDLVLQEHASTFEMAASASGSAAASTSLRAFVVMGVEHILTGWDHLLFLLGLVLLAGKARSLALTISAFTAAHSITLGLAAFGLWAPPASIVEPAIALSIAYVGVENVRALVGRREATVTEKRWRLTFAFGLVHGFGFASALQGLGMSRADVPRALVGFNAGVEIGQLAIVLPVVTVLAWVARHGKLPPRVVSFASAALVVLGLSVFVARVV